MPVKSKLNGHTLKSPSEWFGAEVGQQLLVSESHALESVLSAQPAGPWLWMGLPAIASPSRPYGIELHGTVSFLNIESEPQADSCDDFAEFPLNSKAVSAPAERVSLLQFGGAFRGALPLPLASDSLNAVVIQHVTELGIEWSHLFREAHRVLRPGGVLWVSMLNPISPFRLRARAYGVHSMRAARWRQALVTAGFGPDDMATRWLGPHWRLSSLTSPDVELRALQDSTQTETLDRFRAVLTVTACKRTVARIPGTPVRSAVVWQPAKLST